MNQADKKRTHLPLGYKFKLNPETKPKESLLSPEGYLIVYKKLARNKSRCMEH